MFDPRTTVVLSLDLQTAKTRRPEEATGLPSMQGDQRLLVAALAALISAAVILVVLIVLVVLVVLLVLAALLAALLLLLARLLAGLLLILLAGTLLALITILVVGHYTFPMLRWFPSMGLNKQRHASFRLFRHPI